MAALTFCLVTAASQTFPCRIWKKLVLAMFVTGDLTWPLAWMTFTRKASTAFRLKRNTVKKLTKSVKSNLRGAMPNKGRKKNEIHLPSGLPNLSFPLLPFKYYAIREQT